MSFHVRGGLLLALGTMLALATVALDRQPRVAHGSLSVGRRAIAARFEAENAVGPQHGALVIGGGGPLSEAIWRRFIALAGGPEAAIVVIPTASSLETFSDEWPTVKRLRALGCKNVTILHTRDRRVADTEEFVTPLRRARGVWISGGKQWKLVATYFGTLTQRALFEVLQRGGVVGGTSAGATIQGAVATFPGRIGQDEDLYAPGFGFLPQVAIDQHLLARQRENDLIGVVQEHPEWLGIGIDERTAVVVQDDCLDVMGESKVAIYDPLRMDDEDEPPFYFLDPGDRFDLRTRSEIAPVVAQTEQLGQQVQLGQQAEISGPAEPAPPASTTSTPSAASTVATAATAAASAAHTTPASPMPALITVPVQPVSLRQ
jgi:cyanophycinase